jgi:hypothetical protein
MKNSLSAIKTMIVTFLALSPLSAFGSQVFCSKGLPETALLGFFKISDKLSCPDYKTHCVDYAKCPIAQLPNCPADSTFESVVNGFIDIEEGVLACPKQSGGCVNLSKCPAIAPIKCDRGHSEAIVVGYRKIDNQYSCPIIQMACVDIAQCPLN